MPKINHNGILLDSELEQQFLILWEEVSTLPLHTQIPLENLIEGEYYPDWLEDWIDWGIVTESFVSRSRYDFGIISKKILFEVQGGTESRKTRMGHSSPEGQNRDCMKQLIAHNLGWKVIPLTRKFITTQVLKSISSQISEQLI